MKIFKIKGKEYILDTLRHRKGNDTLTLTLLDKNKKLIIDEVAKRASEVISKKKLMEQILSTMPFEEVLKIHKDLTKKKKKPKAKEGCYEVRIGNNVIPIID